MNTDKTVRVTDYRGHKLTIQASQYRIESKDQDLPHNDKTVEYTEDDTISYLEMLDGKTKDLLDLRQSCAEFMVDQFVRELRESGVLLPAYI